MPNNAVDDRQLSQRFRVQISAFSNKVSFLKNQMWQIGSLDFVDWQHHGLFRIQKTEN
jgi:hypothetical protein